MNYRIVFNLLGRGVMFVGLVMVLPMLTAFFYGENDLVPLEIGSILSVTVGIVMIFLTRRQKGELRHREGFLFVTLAWSLAGAMGAIPYWLSGYFDSYLDALFETISGFTTTGASVLTNVEALPHGLLLWRALTQWLGGMGIIVLTIAILPFLGVGGMQLFKAESPGPTMDKLKPRITETAKLLWSIYVGITILEIVLLGIGGMDIYDSACHAFATMATGGFSPRNASVAAYDSAYIDTVITVFMMIAGANFALHYAALSGNAGRYLKSMEFKWYVSIFALACVFIMWNTRGVFSSFGESLRFVTFQVSSIMTTTGFATYDYIKWPVASQLLLLLLMVIGGCAGSTGGGMKVMRLGILLKYAHREILKLVHPNAVVSIKWDDNPVSQEVLSSILGFFVFYVAMFVVASLFMGMLGLDIVTSVSSVIACMSNIGPGLSTVGPTGNFAHIPDTGKAVLTFCMLAGRLELYTVMVVLSPSFWKA